MCRRCCKKRRQQDIREAAKRRSRLETTSYNKKYYDRILRLLCKLKVLLVLSRGGKTFVMVGRFVSVSTFSTGRARYLTIIKDKGERTNLLDLV